MEQLMEILAELRPDVDFENEKSLVTGGVLDSFDIISLVGMLNDEYDIILMNIESRMNVSLPFYGGQEIRNVGDVITMIETSK